MDSQKEIDQSRKKKTRRKKKSKCTATSKYAIEGTPFKDLPGNGISIGVPSRFKHCLLPVSLSAEKREIKGIDMFNNLMTVKVGVSYKTLVNKEIISIVSLGRFVDELAKLLKQVKRLHCYEKIVFANLNSVFPDICTETYSCKVVFHVIYYIMSHVLPSSLLGSKENFKMFMKQVRRVVFGCHRQSFSLTSLVHGQKVSHISWLQFVVPSNSLRLHLLACLIKWLLLYVQGILRKLFYMTIDSSKKIIYYNKNKWKKREQEGISLLVANGKIKKVEKDSEEIKKLVDIGRTQFQIKTNGLRPITKFCAPNETEKILRSQARLLLSQWAYLSGCLINRFSPGVDEVLRKELLNIVSCYPDPTTRPFYYFVRTDVKDAFGSIDHCKMLTILNGFYKKFVPGDNKVKICKVFQFKPGRKTATPTDMFECANMPIPSCMTKLESKICDIRPLFHRIQNRVNCSGAVFGRTTYRICRGIPQGMDLSCILCELYYNALDKEHLESFRQTGSNEVFIRYCDDYLFLSPSKERAEQFLQKISSGFPDYHVQFNSSKTVTNLFTESSTVSFCGFTIDLHIFCIKGNFDSFKNRDVGHTLKLDRTQHLGKTLLRRMTLVLKLNPVLIDRRLNTKHVAAENVYQAALLMAFRCIAFIRHCLPGKKVTHAHIIKCIKLGCKSIKKRVMKVSGKTGATGFGSVKGFSTEEIKWLVYKAFITCMVKSENWCSKALKYLKATCMQILQKLNKFQASLLQRVSNPSLPGVFSTMKWWV